MTYTDHAKQFRKAFDDLSYRRSWHETFRDFIEIAACTIHQEPYFYCHLDKDDDYDRIEQRYLDTIKKYTSDEIELIVTLYSTSLIALRTSNQDFLGQQYMDLEVSNKHNGEFFTPNEISRMIAKMQMHGIGSKISAQGYITLQEPACGAGVMIIEAANAIREEGHDPCISLLFQAIDINRTCFNMAYFQLSALRLPGVVVHGDTLRMEEWESRATPQWKMMQKHGVSAHLLPNAIQPITPAQATLNL